MHTPPGENEYISVNVSLFVIYIMYTFPLHPWPTHIPLPRPPFIMQIGCSPISIYNINWILFLNPRLYPQLLHSVQFVSLKLQNFVKG